MVTNSIVAMLSGDSTIQYEILSDVGITVAERILAEPSSWWRTRDVVDLYCQKHREILTSRAERAILAPLGMTTDSFIANQADMDQSVVERLVDSLTAYELPGVHAIFAGVDTDGPSRLLKSGAA